MERAAPLGPAISPEVERLFPGNWLVERARRVLKAYELSLKQNWNPLSFDWGELDRSNFDRKHAFAMAYWFAKLAIFERSGIGAFSYGMYRAASQGLPDPIPKALCSIAYDQCRHDEICRRACEALCPGFPYRFKPRDELERDALNNIQAMHRDAARYWRAFIAAWGKYRPYTLFGGFSCAEIGAELIFSEVARRSKLRICREMFLNVARDEARHLMITTGLIRHADPPLTEQERREVSRLLLHGFIYLSPLLYRPWGRFWRLPDRYLEVDTRLEELAMEAGLGLMGRDERAEAWRRAFEAKRGMLSALGVEIPEIPEIGVSGLKVSPEKGPVGGAL
jgi:hypothetical protein